MLLQMGMASENFKGIRRLFFCSRSILLPKNLFYAIFYSLWHYFSGMWQVVAIVLCLNLVSVKMALIELTAVSLVILLFIFSILLHELGHAVSFRISCHSRSAICVSHGLRCYLVRPRLNFWREVFVVISGPFAPAVFGLGFAFFAPVSGFILLAWIALSVGHILCLFFPKGDGLNFLAAIQLRSLERSVVD